MKVTEHESGFSVIEPTIIKDERGCFFESFKKDFFEHMVNKTIFIQENTSISKKNVLRGLHYQTYPYTQSKLVRVTYGEVMDVIVDIRKNSPTFGCAYKNILSFENNKQIYIPKGFAHGFIVLSDVAIFEYKVDEIYEPAHEKTILWSDESLNIDWSVDITEIIVSEKDMLGESFEEIKPL